MTAKTATPHPKWPPRAPSWAFVSATEASKAPLERRHKTRPRVGGRGPLNPTRPPGASPALPVSPGGPATAGRPAPVPAGGLARSGISASFVNAAARPRLAVMALIYGLLVQTAFPREMGVWPAPDRSFKGGRNAGTCSINLVKSAHLTLLPCFYGVCVCVCVCLYVRVHVFLYTRVCMCFYIHVCACVFIHTRVHVFLYTRVCMCFYIHACASVFIYTRVHVFLYTRVCLCFYIHACACVFIYTCVHV